MSISRSTLAAAAAVAASPCSPVAARDVPRVTARPGYADPDLARVFEGRHDAAVQVTHIDSDDRIQARTRRGDGEDLDGCGRREAPWNRIRSGDPPEGFR